MARLGSLAPERCEPHAGGGGGFQRERASVGPVSVGVSGKESEDGVADDIEHLAALFHHGAGRAIKIRIEQVKKGIDRELIGKARRVPGDRCTRAQRLAVRHRRA